MRFKALMLLVAFLVLPLTALAVPLQVPYSGQLSENGSLVNGVVELTVKLYPTPTGGSELYTESFPGTAVQNGIYHLMLSVPQKVWDGSDRWLSVSVNGGSPLEPRVQIGSVAYSVRADTASKPLPTGIASSERGGMVKPVSGPAFQWTAIDSITINLADEGYILALACGYVGPAFGKPGNWGTQFQLSVSTPAFQQVFCAGTNDQTIIPFAVIRKFDVLPGTFKVKLWARNTLDETNHVVLGTMHLIFVPYQY